MYYWVCWEVNYTDEFKTVTKLAPMADECLPGGLKGQPHQLQTTKNEIDL